MTTTLDAVLDSAIDHLDDDAPSGTSSQLPPVPARPAVPRASSPLSSIDQLIALGQRSPAKRVKALADKIDGDLVDLRQRIVDASQAEHERREQAAAKEQARGEVQRLERQLAAARARLKGRPTQPEPSTPAAGERVCPSPGCGRIFSSGQAIAMHRRRAHDGFDPNAGK